MSPGHSRWQQGMCLPQFHPLGHHSKYHKLLGNSFLWKLEVQSQGAEKGQETEGRLGHVVPLVPAPRQGLQNPGFSPDSCHAGVPWHTAPLAACLSGQSLGTGVPQTFRHATDCTGKTFLEVSQHMLVT